MALLLGFFLLSIVFSFLCSIWEAVLLSVTPSYIKRAEKDGKAVGPLLAELKKDIDKPLSAILTLNTIAHTVGAIGVGAQAGALFASKEISLFGIAISYESIIATLMTLGILFLSEIFPKTIGANNWQSLAPFTARSVKILMFILKPIIWISYQLTRVLKKDKNRSVFSKNDFAAMAEVVSESGEIQEEDYRLIKNILQFDDLVAKDIMTPRRVIVMANENQTLAEYYAQNQPFIFSRIPIFRETRDQVVGIVLKDEILQNMVEGNGDQPLKAIKRDMIPVLETTPLRQVFEKLNVKFGHIALVVDSYGSVIGLVTLEDVIETLFGLEIMDETDTIDDLQAYARKKWAERAEKLGLVAQEPEEDTSSTPPPAL